MPLYEYFCSACNFEFEILRKSDEDISVTDCLKCQGKASKKASVFGFSIAGGSPNETIDKTIGRDAEQKWQKYHDDQSQRREGKELKSVDSPKSSDGKYMPILSLGDETGKKLRKTYSDSLKEYKEKQKEKEVAV